MPNELMEWVCTANIDTYRLGESTLAGMVVLHRVGRRRHDARGGNFALYSSIRDCEILGILGDRMSEGSTR